MVDTRSDTQGQRHALVTALVALVEHVGSLPPAQSLKTDRFVMDVVDAAEITHEEYQRALNAILSRGDGGHYNSETIGALSV